LPVAGTSLGAASKDRQPMAGQIDTTKKKTQGVDLAGRRLT
jgi:hypothetical protein